MRAKQHTTIFRAGRGAPGAHQEKHTVVYQRYCHVYKEGELEKLFEKIPGCKVEAAYFDFGNWCVEVRVTRELK